MTIIYRIIINNNNKCNKKLQIHAVSYIIQMNIEMTLTFVFSQCKYVHEV